MNAEELRNLMDHDPDTGEFTRKTGRFAGKKAGTLGQDGYVYINLRGRHYKAHRLAWLFAHGAFPPDQVDHINGVSNDNRISNLRLASNSQNQQNRRKVRVDSKTGVQGVSAVGAKFMASIKTNGRNVYLGLFGTIDEARAAYLSAKRQLHPFFVEEPKT